MQIRWSSYSTQGALTAVEGLCDYLRVVIKNKIINWFGKGFLNLG